MRQVLVFSLFVALCACQTSQTPIAPTRVIDQQDQASAVQSECAIYYAVNAKRVDDGLQVIASLTQGCPAGTDSIAADIRPRPGFVNASNEATTLKKRMIARGMPTNTANAVATSASFRLLVAEIAAL